MSITEKKEERRQEIIRTAKQVFKKFGFKKTAIIDIGAEIGLNQASIYYYFQNKEEIFAECLIDELDLLKAELKVILASDEPIEEKICKIFSMRFRLFQENVILQESYEINYEKVPERLKNQLLMVNKQEHTIIQSLLKNAIEKGEISVKNPEKFTNILIHISQGIRFGNKFNYVLTNKKPVLEENLKEIENTIYGLFGELRKEGK